MPNRAANAAATSNTESGNPPTAPTKITTTDARTAAPPGGSMASTPEVALDGPAAARLQRLRERWTFSLTHACDLEFTGNCLECCGYIDTSHDIKFLSGLAARLTQEKNDLIDQIEVLDAQLKGWGAASTGQPLVQRYDRSLCNFAFELGWGGFHDSQVAIDMASRIQRSADRAAQAEADVARLTAERDEFKTAYEFENKLTLDYEEKLSAAEQRLAALVSALTQLEHQWRDDYGWNNDARSAFGQAADHLTALLAAAPEPEEET